MKFSLSLIAFAASLSPAAASAIKGFNYGSTNDDGSNRQQSDFQSQFSTAQGLTGAPGFTSARLYTMIQGGTTNTPISAIPAAISTNTTLLLGLWASAGQADFNNEIAALSAAISQYGEAFTSLVTGISIGSEDLYRVSPTGIAANEGTGANPSDLVSYISQVRGTIANTGLSKASIGHVDTWTAWVNGSNSAVINAVDWLGVDAYPYFQNTEANSIQVGNATFFEAYYNTTNVAGKKDVWVTETGWPVYGATENQAVASDQNAQTYWQQTGCSLFDNINTYWYTLQDYGANPSFGIVGQTLSTSPLFDLSCS